ncbi:Myb-like_DNA-binding domain-containing protein [Hexamita inflata]|uniref:Myb-like DNA-binding domain-containing protein n=1 Tax=Hexamita inflata TaxID=28002 RepID=A0AA86QHV8_9EUKA|nr:Myb-like DNA-binding domain-containing protein [Hexamita inflata]
MSNQRTYHKWTDAEVKLLYKTVTGSNRDWVLVRQVFPMFTLMQLQNKFSMIQKQYRRCYHSPSQTSQTPETRTPESFSVQDTINVLLSMIKCE